MKALTKLLLQFLVFLLVFQTFPVSASPQQCPSSGSSGCSQAFKQCSTEDPAKCEHIYWFQQLFYDSLGDYALYYGRENLPYFIGVLLAGGFMANTKMDHCFHKFYQRNIKSRETTAFLTPFDTVGFFPYNKCYVGFYLANLVLDPWTRRYDFMNTFFDWNYRCLRALLIVSPQITLLRKVLGGGRPEPYPNSRWHLGKSSRPSCSGHTFNGALPLLTIAMMTDVPEYRVALYALSILPGLCRINDSKHYLSQTFIGWTLAYLAVRNVDNAIRQSCDPPLQVGLLPIKNGAMVYTHFRF